MATMQETIAKANKEIAEWNSAYPVGQRIWYNKAAGDRIMAQTTSEAKLVGFEAVIYINEADGHKPLSRMTAIR